MDISIRELKANPRAAIKRAQAGERVRITAHRKVVAELVAPGASAAPTGPGQVGARADGAMAAEPAAGRAAEDATKEAAKEATEEAAAIARLMSSGLITQPASKPFRLPRMVKLPESADGRTVSDLVIDGRGPR